jgi:hypothetical protein
MSPDAHCVVSLECVRVRVWGAGGGPTSGRRTDRKPDVSPCTLIAMPHHLTQALGSSDLALNLIARQERREEKGSGRKDKHLIEEVKAMLATAMKEANAVYDEHAENKEVQKWTGVGKEFNKLNLLDDKSERAQFLLEETEKVRLGSSFFFFSFHVDGLASNRQIRGVGFLH